MFSGTTDDKCASGTLFCLLSLLSTIQPTSSSRLQEMERKIIHNLGVLKGQSVSLSRCFSNQLRPQPDVVPVKYDEMGSSTA